MSGCRPRTSHSLKTLLWNSRSLCDKVNFVELSADDLRSDVIFITEHWLLESEITVFKIENFVLGSCYSRPGMHRGGSAIFIRSKPNLDLTWKAVPRLTNLAIMNVFEVSACLLDNPNILLVCIYRIPDKTNFKTFLHKLSEMLQIVSSMNCDILIAGDYNIDLRDSYCPFKTDFSNLITSFGLNLMLTGEITRPSSVNLLEGSCIDNYLTNLHPSRWSAAVIPTTASDHYMVSSSLDLAVAAASNQRHKGPTRRLHRRHVNATIQVYLIATLGPLTGSIFTLYLMLMLKFVFLLMYF